MPVVLSGAPLAAAPSAAVPFGPLTIVTAALVLDWQMVGERCEHGATTSPKRIAVVVTLEPGFPYKLSFEGWRSVGACRIVRFGCSPLRSQSNQTLCDFDLGDNGLEKWSEGDAAFLCGRLSNRQNSRCVKAGQKVFQDPFVSSHSTALTDAQDKLQTGDEVETPIRVRAFAPSRLRSMRPGK
jgi:hypothetical protein